MTQEKFQIIYDEQQQSGLSQIDFCKQKGIAASTFGYWRRKLLHTKSRKGFIDLGTHFSSQQIEIHLPNHIVIKVPADLSREEIKTILEAVS